MSVLDEQLQYQLQQADNVAIRFKPPNINREDALLEINRSGQLVVFLLDDIEEALNQVFNAGLAFPDPELTDELNHLAQRASEYQAISAMRYLQRLSAWINAIQRQANLEIRQQLATHAWQELQQFMSWLRLFRHDHDLSMLQSRLLISQTQPVQQPTAFPIESLSVWPVGLQLSSTGSVLLFARDLTSERWVILHDYLTDYNPHQFLQQPAISRLFQDMVCYCDILSGIIQITEHPVIKRHHTLLLRPAFRAIPQCLPITDHFTPPPLPTLQFDQPQQKVPSQIQAQLKWHQDQVQLHYQQHIIPLTQSNYLTVNLQKLLIQSQQTPLTITAIILPVEDEFQLLQLSTTLHERSFPEFDPSLYLLHHQVLLKRIAHYPLDSDGLWLRTTVFLLNSNHNAFDAIQALWDHATLTTHYDYYRFALAQFLLGQTLDRQTIRPLIADQFQQHHLNSNDVYQLLWLAIQVDVVNDFTEQWQPYINMTLQDPDIATICTRSLLINYYIESTAASEFLHAYIKDLPLLPDALELFQLADTMALIDNGDRYDRPLSALNIDTNKLRQTAANQLCHWLLDDDPDTWLTIGDTLLMLASADLDKDFICYD